MRRAASLALLIGGLLTVTWAVLFPFVGEDLLLLFRGRPIRSLAACEVLPRLLGLAALVGLGCGALLVSGGLLLMKSRVDVGPNAVREPGRKGSTWLVAPIVAAFGLILVVKSRESLNYDEIIEVVLNVRPTWEHALIAKAWTNHYAGTILARMSRVVFGESEAGLRGGAVLVSTLGLATASAWVARLSGASVGGLWLAAFLGLHPLVLALSAQVRGYSFLMWAGAVTFLGVAIATWPGRRPMTSALQRVLNAVGIGVAAVALGLSHLFGLAYLVCLTGLVHILAWTGSPFLGWPRRSVGIRGAVCNALPELETPAAVLSLATAVSVLISSPNAPWLFYRTNASATQVVARVGWNEMNVLLTGQDASFASLGLVLLGFGTSAPYLWRHRPESRILVISAIVPVGGAVAAAQGFKPIFFYARFLALGLVLAALVISWAFGDFVSRRVGCRTTHCLVALGFVSVAAIHGPNLVLLLERQRGYREACGVLSEMATDRATGLAREIFLCPDGETKMMLGYYSPFELPRLIERPNVEGSTQYVKTSALLAGIWAPGEEAPDPIRVAVRRAGRALSIDAGQQNPVSVWVLPSDVAGAVHDFVAAGRSTGRDERAAEHR